MKTRRFFALLLTFLLLLPCVTALAEETPVLNDPTGRQYLNAIGRALRLKDNADPSFICGELKNLKANIALYKLSASKANKQLLDEAIRISGGFTDSQFENQAFWNKELVKLNKQFAKSDAAKRTTPETAIASDSVTFSGTLSDASGTVLSPSDIASMGPGVIAVPDGYTLTPAYEGSTGTHTITLSATDSFYKALFNPLSKLYDKAMSAAAGQGVLEGATARHKAGKQYIIIP